MSKIGILTFHRSINYGAYMQCLALSHEIQKRFPDDEVEVVDYNSCIMENNYRIRFKINMVKRPLELYCKYKRKKVFRDSLKYLPLSPKQIIDDGCDRVFEYIRDRYDVIIVGSDAVWNWIKRGFPNPYLLNMDADIPRLSYGASAFGMGMEHVTEEKRNIFGKSLSSLKFVGVRDYYTEYLVHYCAPDVKTEFTCDPTAFLDLDYVMQLLGTDKAGFREHIYNKYHIPENKRLIGVMGTNRNLVKRLKSKYKDTHYIVSVFCPTGAEDIYMYDISPLEWSLLFGLFDLTITNFFHGTLLSLRNSTPVISIEHTKFGTEYKGKMQDILERMNLGECFFTLKDGLCNNWNKITDKADMLLSDPSLPEKINSNRHKMIQSAEKFFEALRSTLNN